MANNERFIPIKMTLDLADARRQLNTLDPSVNASAKKIEDRFKSVTSTIDKESKKISSSVGSSLGNETLLRQLDQLRIGAEQLSRGSLGGLPNIIKAIALSSGQAEKSIKGAREQTASFATVVKLLDKSLSDNGVLGQQGGKKLFESFETSLIKASKTGSAEATKLREDFKRFGIEVEQALLKPQKAFNQFLGVLSGTKKAGEETSAGNILNRRRPELGSLAVDQASINAAKEAGRVIKDLTVAEEGATVATGGLSKSTLIAAGIIGGLAIAVIGAGVAIVKLSNDAGKLQAELERVADETGLSIDRIQFLQAAAKATNVEFGSITKAYEAYRKAAFEANQGNEELAKIFKILGQTTKNVSEDSFAKFILSTKQITDESLRLKVAQAVTSDNLRGLSRLYDELTANGGKWAKKLQETSQLMDGPANEAAKKYNQTTDDLDRNWNKFYYTLANKVVPVLNETLRLFNAITNANPNRTATFPGMTAAQLDALNRANTPKGIAPFVNELGIPITGFADPRKFTTPGNQTTTDALREALRKKEKGSASLQTPPDPRQSIEARNNALIALEKAKNDAIFEATARRIEAEILATDHEYAVFRSTYEEHLSSVKLLDAQLLAARQENLFRQAKAEETALREIESSQQSSIDRINQKENEQLKKAKTGDQRIAIEKSRAAALEILDNQILTQKLQHRTKIAEINNRMAQAEDELTAKQAKAAQEREVFGLRVGQTYDRLQLDLADLQGAEEEAFSRQIAQEYFDSIHIATQAGRQDMLDLIETITKLKVAQNDLAKLKNDSLLRSDVLNSQLSVQEEQIRGLQIRGIVNETQATDQLILAKRAMRESLLGELEVRRALLATQANTPGKGQDDAKRDLAALDEQIARVRNLGGELTRAESIQLRLAKQGQIEYGRLNERVEDLLASQRGLTEIFQDFRASSVQTAFDGIDSAVNKLTEHLGFAKDLVGDLLKGFLRLAATKIFEKLLNLNSGGGGVSFGGAAQQQGGGGFNPLSLLQQIGGGGQGGGFSIPGLGPGGTAGFNGNAGLGLGNGGPISLLNKIPVVNKLFSGGGVLGKIGSVLGLGGGAAAGTGALTGGSIAAGIASSPALGLAGAGAATGGLLGGTITGGAAAGGGGLLASIGALATNPITIGIAAAIGGGLLLWKLFSGRDLKKLRSTIQGEYSVDVKDKNVLKQIKEIGQGQFGKSWKDKMLDTVRLEPSKNIITSYAEATGQNTAKLTLERRKLDPNDPINRYEIPIARENGGRVWPGQDFLVGERRAEVVRFDRPGTVFPSVEAYQQGNGRSTGNGGGVPAGLVQALVQMIGQLSGELARIGSIPADEILTRNAEAVARAANEGQRGSRYAINTFSEVYG